MQIVLEQHLYDTDKDDVIAILIYICLHKLESQRVVKQLITDASVVKKIFKLIHEISLEKKLADFTEIATEFIQEQFVIAGMPINKEFMRSAVINKKRKLCLAILQRQQLEKDDEKNNELTPLLHIVIDCIDCVELDMLEFILQQANVDVNQVYDSYTPLQFLFYKDQIKDKLSIIKCLYANGADLDKSEDYETPLYLCLEKSPFPQQQEIIDFFVAHGVKLSAFSALKLCLNYNDLTVELDGVLQEQIVFQRNKNMMKESFQNLKQTNNFNVVDNSKFNLLHFFFFHVANFNVRHETGILKVLMGLNINLEYKDYLHNTPLYYAMQCQSIICAKFYLQTANVDFNCQNKLGQTPIMFWLQGYQDGLSGYLQYVEKLSFIIHKFKVDLNLQDNEGRTILNYLCSIEQLAGFPQIIKNFSGDKFNFFINERFYNGLPFIHTILYCFSKFINSGYTEKKFGVILNNILKVFEVLVNKPEIDLNITDKSGNTLLHKIFAYDLECKCKYVSEDKYQLLLSFFKRLLDLLLRQKLRQKQCDLNFYCKNRQGETPLYKLLISSFKSDVVFKAYKLQWLVEHAGVQVFAEPMIIDFIEEKEQKNKDEIFLKHVLPYFKSYLVKSMWCKDAKDSCTNYLQFLPIELLNSHLTESSIDLLTSLFVSSRSRFFQNKQASAFMSPVSSFIHAVQPYTRKRQRDENGGDKQPFKQIKFG